jgi:hypothetical protein
MNSPPLIWLFPVPYWTNAGRVSLSTDRVPHGIAKAANLAKKIPRCIAGLVFSGAAQRPNWGRLIDLICGK